MHPLFGTKYNGRMDGSGISFFRSPVFFFRQGPQIIICTVYIFPASEFFISALIITCVWYKCIIFRTALFAFYQICRKIRAGGSQDRIIGQDYNRDHCRDQRRKQRQEQEETGKPGEIIFEIRYCISLCLIVYLLKSPKNEEKLTER